ncbi:hypothetical protein ACLMAL_28940 [Nocardia sp. CWNU-33]|uniref:hypothetical protein n=1 Tax=Nocardia sp. CWNU-33 TaxID=3392117 RepID=UPI00398F16F0
MKVWTRCTSHKADDLHAYLVNQGRCVRWLWSLTTVSTAVREIYRGQLNELDLALIAHRQREPDRSGRTSSRNGITATDSCSRRIRLAPSVYRLGGIVCAVCGGEFDADFRSEQVTIWHVSGTT